MKYLYRVLFILIISSLTLSLTSCGDKVDSAISDFETIVENAESLAKQDEISKDDIESLKEDMKSYEEKYGDFDEHKNEKMTKEQEKEMEDLGIRFATAAMTIAMKNPDLQLGN